MKAMKPAASIAAAACSAYQSHISTIAKPIQKHVRVLLPLRGSGNYGESGTSAFYTIDQLPAPLATPQSSSANNNNGQEHELKREDIDLGHDRLAFTIDNVLTHDEADALAACAEAVLEENGHSRLAPGIQTPPGMRINEAAHWYPPHGAAFLPSIFSRVQHLVPETLGGLPLHGKLSEKVAQFKYEKGDQFNRHVDGLFPGQGANPKGNGVDEWNGVVSGMSMLFFLNDKDNDGLEGGSTRLWSADGNRFVDVTPKKGRVLFFRRGSPDAVLHAGLEVTGEVPKYMALINLAYGEQTGTRSMM